jgi:hypothetical protein
LFGRVSANEKILAAIPFIREDIEDIKRDCAATRTWVEEEMKTRRAEEAEEVRLTAGQKVAIIGAVAVVCASLIGAIASLIGAGAFS